MKAVKKISVILVFLFVCMITNVDVQAQCPMCKAAVESSVKSGQSNAGKGLNDGILYLLAAPYLLVGALGYIWYRNYRVKTKTDVKDEKIILN